ELFALQEVGESVALGFGEEDREARLTAIHVPEDRDLVAEILAAGTDLVQNFLHANISAGEPRTQFGTLGELLVEHNLCLAEVVREIRNAGVEHRGGRQTAEKLTGVTKPRHLDLCQIFAQLGQLLDQLIGIAAPRNIVLHRHRFQTVAGNGLIAGVENFLATVVLRDVDFTFDHADARSLHAAAHTEHSTSDRDA